jgi:hypothetical protein
MNTLPSDASAHSRVRYALAQELAAQCPSDLGDAIAVMGSVSRGIADRFSDIELFFWVEELQPVEVYQAWLRRVGADVKDAPAKLHPGTLSTKSWYHGIFIEASWRRWDSTERTLHRVLAAKTTDHWQLTDAWHVADALPLRPHERLTQWQEQLTTYPEALQRKLIASATGHWAEPHWWPLSIVNTWPPAYRNARLELAERLCWRLEETLRLLFAINRRWEPDWKWLEPESRRLTIAPERLVERVNKLFMLADAQQSVTECLRLMLDTLALVPPTYDLHREQEQIRAALHPEQLLTREQQAI